MPASSYKKPVFIAGMPRSGTTLLHGILCNSGLYFPMPETHFFSHAACGFPEQNLSRKAQNKIWRVLTKRARIEVDRESIYRLGSKKEVFEYIVGIYNKDGTSTFLEKTPRHVFFYSEIMRHYPDARFICMVREPKNVASSQLTLTSKQNKSVIRISLLYNKITRAILDIQNQPNVLALTYEDLTDETESVLKTVCEFLKIPYVSRLLDNVAATHEIITSRAFWQERNVGWKEIRKSNPDKWRQFLDDGQANLVNYLTQTNAARFGYRLPYRWPGVGKGAVKDITKLLAPREFKKVFSKVHG
jgi:hypothetical protein